MNEYFTELSDYFFFMIYRFINGIRALFAENSIK